MTLRVLGCVLLAAACLLLSADALQAGESTAGRLKFGASGQVYAWHRGTC